MNCEYQPGSVESSVQVLAVPVVASVSKFCVIGVPRDGMLTLGFTRPSLARLPSEPNFEIKQMPNRKTIIRDSQNRR